MIARISGRIIEKNQDCLLIDIGGISYEVFIPSTVMQRLQHDDNSEIQLVTYHYHQVEPSRSTPVLIGFLNEVEKEFFEIFITVSGIGPRAALRALNQPISLIAKAIDEGNTEFLKSLPGIGQQRAREIVAKLQNKVGKFGLMQDDDSGSRSKSIPLDAQEEALSVLMQLQYKKGEASAMIKKALERKPDIKTTEEILNEVYKQKRVI